MYTLFNTKSIWPPSPGPVNTGQNTKMYYNTIPATPVLVDSRTGDSTYSYQLQPGWYPPPAAPSRRRLSSDDVFYPEGTYVYEEPVYSYVVTSRLPPQVFCAKRSRTIKPAKRTGVNPNSFESHRSPDTSRTGYTLAPEAYVTPKKYDYFSENSSNTSSNSNESSPSSQIKDDSLVNTLFPSSLYTVLNSDPPEPKSRVTFKTSSPIEGESNALHIDIGKLRKRRGRFVTSSSSEKCPRFSENGVCEDLDQCDKILLKSRCVNSDEDKAQKREEFLLILEAERERQKKLVLPKHTPKMSCKFCKNNGEPPEVYTKHRLHFNEKTVCPLLRHYVCRLCRSTGDYAHTIGHCPFNSKKDKIAYKATFLV
ncbi:uncharacterized protein LOC131957035 [Physella acuta]|uniref:uncharacterized protein LOC131957035 n=1 Tax=Physella acuta TaxID=109671 RepID=UPI0027DB4782|nr:uncharacterized protein LOC131957035 [Physella acuta]